MKTFTLLFLTCLCGATSHAFFFGGGPDWDGLRVTFGLNPFNSYNFASLPRTESEAVEEGWKLKSPSSQYFCGKRYIKYDSNLGADDPAVMLLFDNNGYIAGIQAGIPDNLETSFPSQNIQPPMIHEADKGWYTITAYFVDTDVVCGNGRTSEQYDDQGTGTSLSILNSSENPEDVLEVPLTEDEQEGTQWTRAKCFFSMGRHYWYNLSTDMNCDDFKPSFLMYNGGKLNAFGWAFQGIFPSRRYEHPGTRVLSRFLDPVPQCLTENFKGFSTVHIYLSDSPRTNFC